MRVRVLKPNCLPKRATEGSVGYDVFCATDGPIYISDSGPTKIPLGFALELPEGYEATIRPLSGHNVQGLHCFLETVDHGYRGEVCAVMISLTRQSRKVYPGSRIARMVISRVETPLLEECDIRADRFGGG